MIGAGFRATNFWRRIKSTTRRDGGQFARISVNRPRFRAPIGNAGRSASFIGGRALISPEPRSLPIRSGRNNLGTAVRLALDRISKSYGPLRVLSDVSFGVEAGSVHALVGENGAGKSTLVKIITGMVPADSGTV